MKIFFLHLLVLLFSISGCSAEKNNFREQQTRKSDESINLNSSQLKEFSVSFNQESNNVKDLEASELISSGSDLDTPLDTKKGVNAKSKECYSRVSIPATYKDQNFVIMKKEASFKYEVIPPKYKQEEKKILIQKESQSITVEPAIYKWNKEKEKFTSEPDDQGQSVEKEILVKKRVMLHPPKVSKNMIPAQYKVMQVKTIVKPSEVKRIEIPAVYETISVPVKLTEELPSDWREVLCSVRITTPLLYKIQKKLNKLEYYHVKDIDGKLGKKTLKAIKKYQHENNLAVGQITIETLEKLGITQY